MEWSVGRGVAGLGEAAWRAAEWRCGAKRLHEPMRHGATHQLAAVLRPDLGQTGRNRAMARPASDVVVCAACSTAPPQPTPLPPPTPCPPLVEEARRASMRPAAAWLLCCDPADPGYRSCGLARIRWPMAALADAPSCDDNV